MKTTLLLLATGLLTTASSFAASYTWNGGSGDWSVAGNWTPMTGPPGASDAATINSGTATVSANTSIDVLNLSGGSLGETADVTCTGALPWTRGTMRGGGRTIKATSTKSSINQYQA